MCWVRPRFSWITSTAPLGSSAAANAPINSPLGPAKRISSAATLLGATPLRPDALLDGAAAVDDDGVVVDVAAVTLVALVTLTLVAEVSGTLVDAVVAPTVVAVALSASSLEHAARSATAAVLLSPSSPSRRSASRRVR